MRFFEIETKYRADNIGLDKFMSMCQGRSPSSYLLASGWDHFYTASRYNGFARHRIGSDFNQLTYKRKTDESNNYVRHEDNLNLVNSTTIEQVKSFLGKFGYEKEKSIFKNCFIFKFPGYTAVYYVIYDDALKETGRFIELELDEENAFSSPTEAWDELVGIEKQYKELGISPQGRMRKSLYELVCQ